MTVRFCSACGLRAYKAETTKDAAEQCGCSGCFKALELCTCRPITDQVIDLKREWDTERDRLKREIEGLKRNPSPGTVPPSSEKAARPAPYRRPNWSRPIAKTPRRTK